MNKKEFELYCDGYVSGYKHGFDDFYKKTASEISTEEFLVQRCLQVENKWRWIGFASSIFALCFGVLIGAGIGGAW